MRERRSSVATPAARKPKSIFSTTLFQGNSANCWNTTERSGPGPVTRLFPTVSEPRRHAQARGLAAAGGTDDGNEFLFANLEAHIVDRGNILAVAPEQPRDSVEHDIAHSALTRQKARRR